MVKGQIFKKGCLFLLAIMSVFLVLEGVTFAKTNSLNPTKLFKEDKGDFGIRKLIVSSVNKNMSYAKSVKPKTEDSKPTKTEDSKQTNSIIVKPKQQKKVQSQVSTPKVKTVTKSSNWSWLSQMVPQNFNVSTLKTGLESIVDKYGGRGKTSLYFKDLRTGSTISINEKQQYPCSIIKMAVMATVYNEAAAGNISLGDYQSNLQAMMIYSDNTAYNNILIKLGNGSGLEGARKVNSLMTSIGAPGIILHHGLLPGSNYFTDGGANRASPQSIGTLLNRIYNGQIANRAYCNQMINLMARCADRSALAQGTGTSVFAHKSGWAYAKYHDGGIVYGPNRHYIIVVFTDGISNRSAFFREISSYAYKYQEVAQ